MLGCTDVGVGGLRGRVKAWSFHVEDEAVQQGTLELSNRFHKIEFWEVVQG